VRVTTGKSWTRASRFLRAWLLVGTVDPTPILLASLIHFNAELLAILLAQFDGAASIGYELGLDRMTRIAGPSSCPLRGRFGHSATVALDWPIFELRSGLEYLA